MTEDCERKNPGGEKETEVHNRENWLCVLLLMSLDRRRRRIHDYQAIACLPARACALHVNKHLFAI